ncbi:MAG TPA: DUF1702 family protein [Blastocatellia bacterium]|nr:DUF1702 family protein [Blastocatellia bacterium]
MTFATSVRRNFTTTQIRRRLLGLSLSEVSFSRRGFPGCASTSRNHLERVIQTFIEGYNVAVVEGDLFQLADRLDSSFSPEFVGFAYEGAGFYLGLTDLLLLRSQSRLAVFTQSAAQQHDFIATVGAGFAIARVPFALRRMRSYQQILDPMTAWCLADGYGFHQGFFYWRRFVEERSPAPSGFSLQSRRLFDAGVGRALWWVFGADPVAVASAISRFDDDRQPEMWTGIGTALAYAGGGPPEASSLLLDLSGAYRSDLLSGITLAAHMRAKGRNPYEWTEQACSNLLSMSVAEASGLVIGELSVFMDSWQGSEEDKWNMCYLTLRDRIKRRLENRRSEQAASRFYVETGL